MGELMRFLMWGLLIWLGWRWLTRQQTAQTTEQSPDHDVTPMVKCSQCQVYLPTDEAFHYRNHHFCSQQHQQDFLNQATSGQH